MRPYIQNVIEGIPKKLRMFPEGGCVQGQDVKETYMYCPLYHMFICNI